jgi:site-specific DNA recombinase
MAGNRTVTASAAPTTSARGGNDRQGTRPGPAVFGGGPMKRAALYARVSTDKQEREETIESQLDALYQAVKAGAYEVPAGGVFVDEHASGARLDRPALDRLRDLAAEGAFDTVLVWSPDRLARRYAYQVVLLEELTRCGCEVIFVHHPFGHSPEEQMLLQIQGVFAEYERALIQDRTRRGQLFAARQGRVNWGNPPYGYRYIRKTATTPQHVVRDEAEAEVVRQMYRWCVEEQLSSYAIHKRLTFQGVPTRKHNRHGWVQSSVIEILRDSVYKGDGYYNRTGPGDTRRPYRQRGLKDQRPGNGRARVRRPREEWIPVRVPALIDPETWALAQVQLQRNRQRARRNNTKHTYLLRSLLVCGRCGRRLVGAWNAKGGRYGCAARYPRYAPGACDGRSVMAQNVEAVVWDHVKALLADPAVLQAQYEQGRGDPAVDVRAEQERERIERKLMALDREVSRLIDAYQAEVIELSELSERRRGVEEQGRMLQERLRVIEQQRTSRENELRLLEGVEAFCASVRGSLEEPSFEVRQKVLQLVVDRVMVEDSRVVIQHIVPTRPVRLQTEQQPPEYAVHRICEDMQS